MMLDDLNIGIADYIFCPYKITTAEKYKSKTHENNHAASVSVRQFFMKTPISREICNRFWNPTNFEQGLASKVQLDLSVKKSKTRRNLVRERAL